MEEKEYNPIQEIQPQSMKDKIKEWYLLKEKLGKGKTFGDLVQRQENLEALEKQDMERLETLQKTIDSFATELGVQFDKETGEVQIDSAIANNVDSEKNQQIAETKDELTKVNGEHAQVTKALYGDEANTQNKEVSNNPGVRAIVNQRKKDLMTRDAAAKKLLDDKVKMEVAKDKMDMHGAIHVAQKYRLMLQLEQAKLELIQRIAIGGKEDDLSVQILRQEIQGLTNQIVSLENQFELTHGQYAKEFSVAKSNLENSQKEVEIERKEASAFNKYTKSLTYSEDGVLNGSTIDGVKNGNTIHEQELYDERGVMIFDVADVLSREKTINIDGTVVTCVTEFGPGPNVEDSFYIGDMEQLETNANGATSTVEEKPDIEEELDNAEMGAPTSINVLDREMIRGAYYMINGSVYPPDMLSMVPEEQRNTVAKGLIALGYDRGISTMNPASLATLACLDIAKAVIENAIEDDDFGERKGPFEV
mgnify:CR=1 FL=1